jgi:hypothetical protein
MTTMNVSVIKILGLAIDCITIFSILFSSLPLILNEFIKIVEETPIVGV